MLENCDFCELTGASCKKTTAFLAKMRKSLNSSQKIMPNMPINF